MARLGAGAEDAGGWGTETRGRLEAVGEGFSADALLDVRVRTRADATAAAMGWQLNLDLTGHRLADVPHKAHSDGTLSDVGFRPSSGLSVLEIQIRHPTREFGAFFEHLLLVDDDVQELSYGAAPGTSLPR